VSLGLAITDGALVNKSKDTWIEPTEEEKEANLRHIDNTCSGSYHTDFADRSLLLRIAFKTLK
jgi:hypothetical protein